MYSFEFILCDSIPKLSWCSIVRKDDFNITVYHGSNVETNKTFFVEGAWDNIFDNGDFPNSEIFFGSGGKISNNKVLFSTPTHPLFRLYVISRDKELFVSNSLAFILEITNSSLDYNYFHYQSDIISICNGLNKAIKQIPIINGKVEFYFCCNFTFDNLLNIECIKKNSPQKFIDFNSYKKYLIDGLQKINNNAMAESRKIIYPSISNITSGYDSACCSSLGKIIGCNKTLNVEGYSKSNPKSDSAYDIAKILKYGDVKVFTYEKYRTKYAFCEAEIAATGDFLEPYFYLFENDLKGRLFLSGQFGDYIWDKKNKFGDAGMYLISPDIAGLFMSEHSLRVGYFSVFISTIGFLQHESIHNISNSPEMKAWTLGNNYDRPIPRRILEESGVKREMFGQSKTGMGTSYLLGYQIKKYYHPESYKSLLQFYKINKKNRSSLKQIFYNILFVPRFILLSVQYILEFFNLYIKFKQFIPYRYRFNFGFPSYLFYWGISIVRQRYSIKTSKVNP